MLARMRGQFGRNSSKLHRAARKGSDSGRYHHPLRYELFPVSQSYSEPARVEINFEHIAPLDIFYCLTLIPTTVIHKTIEGDRTLYADVVTPTYSSSDSIPLGSAMCDAPQFDLNDIPAGIWFCQNSIGSPKHLASTPADRKYAVAESP